MIKLYRFLLMWAYRRLAKAQKKPAPGLPLMRDPDAVCNGYSPRKRLLGDFHCDGDGHYLCHKCAHFTKRGEENWTG